MQTIQIENKVGKVKLNEAVTKESIQRMTDEIGKLFGSSAVENGADFGTIMNAAENGIDLLDIEINSPGGSVFDGYTIYKEIHSLRERGVTVNAVITGMAASMASVICMACDKVSIVPHGRMMIHDASNSVYGNAEDLRKAADLLDGISNDIAVIYSEKTGKSIDEVRDLMKSETWMDAKTTIKEGFADALFDIRPSNPKKDSMNIFKSILQTLSPDQKEEISAHALESEILGAQLQEAQAKIDELSGLSAVVIEKELKISELTEKQSEFENKITEFENTVNTLTQTIADKNAEIEAAKNSAGEQAIQQLAAIGQDAPVVFEQEGSSKEEIFEKFKSMPAGAERSAFFQKHKDILSYKK